MAGRVVRERRVGPEPEARGRWPLALQLLLIAAVGAVAYANSLHGGFLWDDEFLVRDNVLIREWRHAGEIFRRDFGGGGGKDYGFYRPLQILSYTANFALGGLDVIGYHLANVAVHLLVAIALFLVVKEIFPGRARLPLYTALLFVVHPIHTETVDYISDRGDLLGALFMLAAFVIYLKDAARGTPGRKILLAVLYALSLFAKETGLALPALALAYHAVLRRRVNRGGMGVLVATAGLYLLARAAVLGPVSAAALAPDGVVARLPGFFVAVLAYLRLLVYPSGLHMEYGQGLFPLTDPRVVGGALVFAALVAVAVVRGRKDPLPAFAAAWFILALAPVSNLYPLPFFMAEHYAYLPSVGFFLVLGSLGERLEARSALSALVLLGGLVAVWTGLTLRQNGTWREETTFLERTLRYAPWSARVASDLGRVYAREGRREEAARMYERAIRLAPGFSHPLNNLGVLMNESGRYAAALGYFEEALRLDPAYGDALYNRGVALQALGRRAEAVGSFRQAVGANPRLGAYRLGLAKALATSGDFASAAEQYRLAVALDPRLGAAAPAPVPAAAPDTEGPEVLRSR